MADATATRVVEGDLHHELGPELDPLKLLLVLPPARIAMAPLARLVGLELADERFYHLDTALCVFARGEVMYLPEAFTPSAQAALRRRVPSAQRIEIGMEDACRLAANSVSIGDNVVLSGCSEHLRCELEARGYRVHVTPLGSFLRSGGAAFCLTLRLDARSTAMRQAGAATAAA